jgi:[ribosomal protein S18]-alanine N-acetyltransferase
MTNLRLLETPDSDQLNTLVHLDAMLMPDQAWSLSLWQSSLKGAEHRLIVIEDLNDQIVAFLLSSFNQYELMTHLLKIAVLPSYQGRSLGSQLISKMEHMARELGYNKIFLEVEVGNILAYQLYLSRGYQVLRRAPKFYSNGSDAYIMIKPLGI